MNQDWIDKSSDVREGEGLNISALNSYLEKERPELEGDLIVEQFAKGFSNLTYLVKKGGHEMVLRRPPIGSQVKSGHNMGREFRILSALSPVYAKSPKPILMCDDETILGAPFYIMERVSGVILRAKMPSEMIPPSDIMADISISFVEAMVDLHNVDYNVPGLSDLGRPQGYVERQVNGWTKRYVAAKTDDRPLLEKTAEWLNKSQPEESGISLIHNDYKYDNIILSPADWSKVVAVLDWEMTTVGDPLMDLGTTLGYWVNHNDPDWIKALALSPTLLSGNPLRSEVAQMYADKSGKDISNIVFYYVYGVFKIAIIAQQIYYRYKKGITKDKRFSVLGDAVEGLSRIAHQAIEKNSLDNLY